MTAAALSVLAQILKEMGIKLASVGGPHTAPQFFAKYWTQHSGKTKQLALRQAVYEVTKVIIPDDDLGLMILATMAHEPIVFEYLLSFINDCFPNDPHPQERARKMCDRHLQNQSFFLWKILISKSFLWLWWFVNRKLLPLFLSSILPHALEVQYMPVDW